MASTRNCTITSRRRAPTASRMPISLVRSVTDTSMMFMMPMPPTISEIAAMLPSNAVIVEPARLSVLDISCSVTSSSFGMLARAKAATEVYSPLVTFAAAWVLTVKSSALATAPGAWRPPSPVTRVTCCPRW